MKQQERKPHRVTISVHKDHARAVNVLDCRLTMAMAFDLDGGLTGDAVDLIAVAARRGLIQALDDIKREDIRADLMEAIDKARYPGAPTGVPCE